MLQAGPGLFALGADLGTAVQSTTFRGRVRRDRLALAIGVGADAAGVDALAHQVVLDRGGAALGQGLVVGVGADPVGVAGDVHLHARVIGAELGDAGGVRVQAGLGVLGQVVLVEGEV